MAVQELFWESNKDVKALAEGLKSDLLVVGTSDTVVGFLASVTRSSFDRLNKIKVRNEKPFLLLVHDKEKIKPLVYAPDERCIRLMDACWPGPVTFILRSRPDVPDFIRSKEHTIAVRVPAHAGLLTVLESIDALFSTSANVSGMPAPLNLRDVSPALLAQVDMVIHSKKEQNGQLPSTILDCTSHIVRVVREGAYPVQKLEKIYGKPFLR